MADNPTPAPPSPDRPAELHPPKGIQTRTWHEVAQDILKESDHAKKDELLKELARSLPPKRAA